MCRIAAYVGPRERLDRLLLTGDHDLVAQSYQPRQMQDALMNADGFGVAWYGDATAPSPALYRTAMPLWGDENFPRMAPHLNAPCALANVRSATPGFAVSTANVSPFVHGAWAFTHNGFLEGFRDGLARDLQRDLSDHAWGAMVGQTDSEHLFALFLDRAARHDVRPGAAAPAALAAALAETVAIATSLLIARDRRGLLALAVTDGRCLAVVRAAVGADAPSMYLHPGARPGGGAGALVASEPFFDDQAAPWRPVPPDQALVLTAAGGPEPVARLGIPDLPEAARR